MMNTQDELWHNYYKNDLSEDERDTVDLVYKAAVAVLKANGFSVANDDRAECLISAITRFIVESRKDM